MDTDRTTEFIPEHRVRTGEMLETMSGAWNGIIRIVSRHGDAAAGS